MPKTVRYLAVLFLAFGVTAQFAFARGYGRLGTPSVGGKKGPGRPVQMSAYTVAPLNIPGSVFSIAVDINERGTVIGVYDVVTESGPKEYTFVWDGKKLETIQHPGSEITSVAGINNSARVLFGNWGSPTNQTAGFYDRKTGVFTALDPFQGKPLNFGVRLTDSGVALGYACEGTFWLPENCISWLWEDGVYKPLQLAVNDPIVVPSYINNRGQVVGYAGNGTVFSGFLYQDGNTQLLYPPGITANEFIPRAISNSGVILMHGETDPNRLWQPFLYDHGTVKLLPEYNAAGQTTWLGMNGRGDLAGLFCSETGCVALLGLRK